MSDIHEISLWLFQGQAFKRGGQLKRIKKRTQEEGHEDRSTLEKRVLGVEMGTPSSSMIFKHDDEYARLEPGCSIDSALKCLSLAHKAFSTCAHSNCSEFVRFEIS